MPLQINGSLSPQFLYIFFFTGLRPSVSLIILSCSSKLPSLLKAPSQLLSLSFSVYDSAQVLGGTVYIYCLHFVLLPIPQPVPVWFPAPLSHENHFCLTSVSMDISTLVFLLSNILGYFLFLKLSHLLFLVPWNYFSFLLIFLVISFLSLVWPSSIYPLNVWVPHNSNLGPVLSSTFFP